MHTLSSTPTNQKITSSPPSSPKNLSYLSNPRFIQSCLGQPTDYTPIWLMRQAGRYLSQYCAIREKAGSFMALAQNPDLACEVTLQPLEYFNLDAAILFSDILTVPDAMGLGLSFTPGEGPRFSKPIRTEEDVRKLELVPLERLDYVFNAIKKIKQSLTQPNGKSKVPLIGFAGSPWTLACYMIEGGPSSNYATIKKMLYERPDLMHRILEITCQSVAAYLNAQIDSGVHAVMLFDSWGGVLADAAFKNFSLHYTRLTLKYLKQYNDLKQIIPRIVFTKGGSQWLTEQTELDCQCLGVDWTCNLSKARQLLQSRSSQPKALQGNLDPQILMTTPDIIEKEAIAVLDSFGTPHTNNSQADVTHIFNCGHGLSQYTPPENVAHLVKAVHDYSRKMRISKSTQ